PAAPAAADAITKPVVLITGAAGNIGTAMAAALARSYHVVGMDRSIPEDAAASSAQQGPHAWVRIDLSSDDSVQEAFEQVARTSGRRLAAVVHLAAVFDFTGEDNPLYEQVNVQGTRRLLRALQSFEVGRFVYSGTMLVHRAAHPGECIDESTPIEPGWAYPNSKAA